MLMIELELFQNIAIVKSNGTDSPIGVAPIILSLDIYAVFIPYLLFYALSIYPEDQIIIYLVL